jgi:hypothetical protein
MAESGELLQRRYEIVARLNQGGMAVAYLAKDTRLGQRRVVLKQMDPLAMAPQDRGWAEATFRQKASILAHLHHPGLASVTDLFEEHGYLYLVMEYVQGETLAARLARVRWAAARPARSRRTATRWNGRCPRPRSTFPRRTARPLASPSACRITTGPACRSRRAWFACTAAAGTGRRRRGARWR